MHLAFAWQGRIKVLAMEMVLAGDKLIVAGPPDVTADEPLAPDRYDLDRVLNKLEEQYDIFAGKQHGILMVISAKGGKFLWERALQAPPVFNGMILAGGRLLIADTRGRIVSYE